MRLQLRRITVLIFVVYLLITLYSCYRLLQKYVAPEKLSRSPSDTGKLSGEAEEAGHHLRQTPPPLGAPIPRGGARHGSDGARLAAVRNATGLQSPGERKVVDIWGKAAIGLYLWQHVLNGSLTLQPGGMWSYGETVIGDVHFRFRTGPGVSPTTVPSDVTHLVLVLNGREQTKVVFSQVWLRSLSLLSRLKHTAVVLLGNESCDNSWTKPYMRTRGGPLDQVFLVYDSTEVDGRMVLQWPLGVATYREFPNLLPESLALERVRPFSCNFFGTVYANSTRERLLHVIKVHKLKCLVKGRTTWQSKETRATLKAYTNALINSDLTLCPVGKNSESYRIYEAMTFGSVPVLEDQVTPGHCDITPYRLLKQLQAPVLYIKDWAELPALLTREAALSTAEVTARRRRVVQWYHDFKATMKQRFVDGVEHSFFTKLNDRYYDAKQGYL